jgi:hypothetical protein
MPRIHLIRNDPGLPAITPIEPGSQIYRSGYWLISEARAQSLIGGQICFHDHQTTPSFFGGVIETFESVPAGEYHGRVLFIFRFDSSCKGITTSRDGWSQEMKIVS